MTQTQNKYQDDTDHDIAELFIEEIEKLNATSNAFRDDFLRHHSVTVYNPLEYAVSSMQEYVRRYLSTSVRVLFLGMNPGPFGMAQTGIPFGDVTMVRDWIGVTAEVGRPEVEHPKRPITGFSCPRSEVSGTRLWGWARDRYGTPENFFKNHFVWNYCPLVFMEESGANRTPDKLARDEQKALFDICDVTLRSLVHLAQPEYVIGVGKFAMKRAAAAVGDIVAVDDILHPSPASPKANKDWKGEVERKLGSIGCLFD
jgi:single-strand selective monofunctional uracil DNA glycosylase